MAPATSQSMDEATALPTSTPAMMTTIAPPPIPSSPLPTSSSQQLVTATAIPVTSGIVARRETLPQRQSSQYTLPRPSFLGNSSSRDAITQVNDQVSELKDQGFPHGLARAMASTREHFPLRIWVVDNSGSMLQNDGRRMVESNASNKSTKKKQCSTVKIVKCTRWAELQQCVAYHSHLSAILQLPTTFSFLNNPGAKVGPQKFGVAQQLSGDRRYDAKRLETEVNDARYIIMRSKPEGCTPLARHISEVVSSVLDMSQQLQKTGEKVCIILATDGLPTDEQGRDESEKFMDALRCLEGLPVWIVIRLCTELEEVVGFYNALDAQMELNIDVLEDVSKEAKMVQKHNPWLNYAMPLHRAREMGCHHRILDLIDERPLTLDEVGEFCSFMFCKDEEVVQQMPDPAGDWLAFRSALKVLLSREKEQWNPSKQRRMPWLDLRLLDKVYGRRRRCGCF